MEKTKSKRGLFISIEGLDEDRNREVVNLLNEKYCNEAKKTIFTTKEEGYSKASSLLLQVEKDDIDIKTELFLILSERRDHLLKAVLPSLNNFNYVVTDGYCHNTFAHYGYGEQININDIYTLNSYMTENIYPDVAFFIDTPVKEYLNKIQGLENRQNINSLGVEHFDRVRSGYLEMAEDKRFGNLVIIDGGLTVDEMVMKIKNYIGTVELAKELKMMAKRKFNDNIDDVLKDLPKGKIININNVLKKRD